MVKKWDKHLWLVDVSKDQPGLPKDSQSQFWVNMNTFYTKGKKRPAEVLITVRLG
jgi:hypothetical protein